MHGAQIFKIAVRKNNFTPGFTVKNPKFSPKKRAIV